jgi:uncharacterized protein
MNQSKYAYTGIQAIKIIGTGRGRVFVPPLSDYDTASAGWSETETRCLELDTSHAVVGHWSGEPGKVTFDRWPYTEVCSILTGRVALEDLSGERVDFGPGDAFIVPKGWAGAWLTLENSTKVFLALE